MGRGSARAGPSEASQPEAVSAVPSLGHFFPSYHSTLCRASVAALQPRCCEWAPLDGAGLFISNAGKGTAYNSGHVLHQQIPGAGFLNSEVWVVP